VVSSLDVSELIDRYPTLYHMAEDGTWPSIQRHGLLSTTALVDLFEIVEPTREKILNEVRKKTISITHPNHGTAAIRDQLPLKFLTEVLTPDTTPQQFLDALNNRVFFWLSLSRLDTLLNAKHYRGKAQTILHVDTASLVSAYGEQIQLAPYNTGSMHVPTAPQRGVNVFVDLANYPHQEWRKKRGPSQDAVVELTVPHSVPNITDFVVKVERRVSGELMELLFKR
jgi:hypothetical protein